MAAEIEEEYKSSLSDLTVNSKPLITMLTMLAEEYKPHASVIVKSIEEHIKNVCIVIFICLISGFLRH